MAKAAISKRTVDAAKPGPSEYVLWDDGGRETVKGFGLKVTPAGAKVYVFQYRLARPGMASKTAPRKITLGRHGSITPDQARRMAEELAADVAKGIDPAQARHDAIAAGDAAKREADERAHAEGELAFDKMAGKFLTWYELDKQRRPSSVAMASLVVNNYLVPALGKKPLPHVTRADLQPILDGIPTAKRGMRRAVFAYASIVFGWAMKERHVIAENPLRSMSKPDAPKARKRVLTDAELADVWRAAEAMDDPFGPFFRLLILTGQRREEVAGVKWSELDRASATWTIPADRAKNKADHVVPLTAPVVAELDRLALALAIQVKAKADEPDARKWPKAGLVLTTTGETPISGISKAKATLDKAVAEARGSEEEPAPIDAWRIHDLRRTLATGFQRLGVRLEVTEATLNHISGSRAGIVGVYQLHNWSDEKRTALDAWARHVAAILKPADAGNVVPIGAATKLAG